MPNHSNGSADGGAPPCVWRWPALLLLGVTAGGISVAVPPVMAALTSPSPNDLGLLVNRVYLIAGGALALMVGVAMSWMYHGGVDTPRNLFMTALAFPAVLSGGINVAHVNATGSAQVQSAESEINGLVKELADKYDAKTWNYVPLDKVAKTLTDPGPLGVLFPGAAGARDVVTSIGGIRLFAARDAFATNPDELANPAGPLLLDIPLRDQRYITVLKKAESPKQLEQLKQQIDGAGGDTTKLLIVGEGADYFLIEPNPKRKSEALIDGINLKERVNAVEPGLYRVK